MRPVLLIDGNNFMFAAQHGSKRLTAGEQEVTAVFGFLAALRNVCERFPDAVPMVLWDSSPSWRFGLYADYKGNRDKNPAIVQAKEALKTQRPLVKEVLTRMGVRQYSIKNQEADDLAGDLSRKLAARGHRVILVTRDGDWQQLVNDQVSWYDHKTEKVIKPSTFEDDTGYKNTVRFLEAKAIHGDSSDNIPGVGGLGEGAAKMILQDHANLHEFFALWPAIRANIEKGSPWSRYRKKIDQAVEDDGTLKRYERNRALMQLTKTYRPEEYQNPSRYDEEALKQMLGRLGFHSILHKFERWMLPFNGKLTE